MKKVIYALKELASDMFNLRDDKADEEQIKESIQKGVHFRGTNLWTLIFAIFIASIGLNVNSTAVVIGAMLISPLMGPIMGIGLGIAINDFDLLKKGAKNLLTAAVFSIATSFFYFSVTPLHDASSELLARTNPSIWDVFIAFFGGLAGIVAGTRKEKSNVIPGVAIATALMPPLCTAGFGLATGKPLYFLGAVYLFFINSLFICLATFLIVKHLRFRKKELQSEEQEKRISRYITIIVIVTVLPSIFLAYRIVQRSIFENNAKRFVDNEFHFLRSQVVTKNFTFDGSKKSIELLMVGQPLPETLLDSLKDKMPAYDLDKTDLVVHQGLDAKQKIDLSEIKASVLEEVFAAERRTDTLPTVVITEEKPVPDLRSELKALYPDIRSYSLGKNVFNQVDTTVKDTMMLFVAHFKKPLHTKEKQRLNIWLKQRLQTDTVKMILQ